MNTNLVLIAGQSTTGKSMSFRNLKNPEGVVYANCENNKSLPYPNKFKNIAITDAMDIFEVLAKVEANDKYHTIIIDSLTFLMDMFETQYVITATNVQKAWGEYAQYFKRIMQDFVAKSSKRIVFTAHTMDVLSETEQVYKTYVKLKGSLMNQGIESFFTTVIATKRLPLTKLEAYKNDLLTVTDREKRLGYKHVFQTELTKETVNERIRSPLNMWADDETYIDNDMQLVFDRLDKFYNGN